MSNLHRSNNTHIRPLSIYRILPAEVAFHFLSLPTPWPTWKAQGARKGACEIRLYGLSLFLVLKYYGESLGWEGTVVNAATFDNGNGHLWPCGKSIGWERPVVK